MKRALLLVIVVVLALAACTGEQLTNVEKDFTLGGLKAHGTELVRKGGAGKTLLQREGRLTDSGDGVRFVVELDTGGRVMGASVRREGAYGKRYVELRASAADASRFELMSRGNDEVVALPAGVVGLTDVDATITGAPAVPATLHVDLANAAFRVDGAPPPVPAATDAVELRHTLPEPFVESSAAVVVKWCKQQSAQRAPLDAAREISAAIAPRLDRSRVGGAPSAMNTVLVGGYDQGGAALLVACMRALAFPARVVSGTADGVPRSWAQVRDGSAWVDVDPTALLPPPPPPPPDPTRALPKPGTAPKASDAHAKPGDVGKTANIVYVARIEGLPSVFGPTQ